MLRSFEKNAKERKNVAFFWEERMPNPDEMWPLSPAYHEGERIRQQIEDVYGGP